MNRNESELRKDGRDGMGFQHWTLFVPDEHCAPGLEVRVIVGAGGISIGGETIKWHELDTARMQANGLLE